MLKAATHQAKVMVEISRLWLKLCRSTKTHCAPCTSRELCQSWVSYPQTPCVCMFNIPRSSWGSPNVHIDNSQHFTHSRSLYLFELQENVFAHSFYAFTLTVLTLLWGLYYYWYYNHAKIDGIQLLIKLCH